MNRNVLIGLGAFVVILVIILIVVLSSGGGKKQKPLVFPSEPVTITFWGLFDEEDIYKESFDGYKQQHSNITIKYVKKDEATYEQDLLNALAGGSAPDIFVLRNDQVFRYLDKLYPAPEQENFYFVKPAKNEPKKDLPTQFNELFVKAASQDLVYDNRIWGAPMYMDTLALYYNPKILETALEEQSQSYSSSSFNISEEERQKRNDERQRISKLLSEPPKNWNDFLEVAKLATKRDGANISRSAVALGTADNVSRYTDILSLLMMQNNTQITAADQKSCSFNLAIKKQDGSSVNPGTAALDFYTSFGNPAKESYSYNNSFPDSVTAFGEGKTAMMFNYAYLSPYLKRKYFDLKFEIAPMPQIKGIIDRIDFASSYPLVVAKNTANPLASWDIIRFLTSKENIKSFNQTAQKPTAILETTKERYKESQTAYLETTSGLQVFDAQSYTASSWYKAGQAQKMEEIFKIMINEVLAGKNSQEAIDAAGTSCTNILKDAEPLIERVKNEP